MINMEIMVAMVFVSAKGMKVFQTVIKQKWKNFAIAFGGVLVLQLHMLLF